MIDFQNLSKLRIGRSQSLSKRVGRGYGSGKGGHTSGRGSKGQKSRTGARIPHWFEGGQLPLTKRMPHVRGFKPVTKKDYVLIGLSDLELIDKVKITPEYLLEEGYVKELKDGVKVLGNGKITKKVELSGFFVTRGAKAAIENVGGKVN